MYIYVDKKMMGTQNIPLLLDEFPQVNFVDSLEKNQEIEALIVMNSTLKSLDIEKFPRLRWIQLLMAGYDGIDIDKIKSLGITVCNARDIFSISIAEDVFSKILYFNRNTNYYLESMKKAEWKPISKEPEIYGSTVSILGTGSIGQEVAKRMKAFGAKRILGYKKTLSSVDFFDYVFNDSKGLNYVIKEADYLIIALPLSEETYNIIDKTRLNLMKTSALLINVARGNVIDQDALIEVLTAKKIRGAGLDVTTPEPLPADSVLWNLQNVFITPHNASSSPEMKNRLFEMTRINLRKYIRNEELLYKL